MTTDGLKKLANAIFHAKSEEEVRLGASDG
jgi:hypothetical protein